jgi:hypothetical protein
VSIQRPGQRVRADEAQVDYQSTAVKATGNVILQMDLKRPINERLRRQRRLSPALTLQLNSSSLEYNLNAAKGEAQDVDGRFHNLHFTAKSAAVDGKKLSIQSASLGACASPDAFYSLSARSIDATLGDKAVARKVGLNIGGFRLLTIPRLPIDLNRDGTSGAHMPLPSIGSSHLAGTFVQWGTAVQLAAGVQSDFRLQWTEDQSFRYFVTTRGFGAPAPIVRFHYKEEAIGRKVQRVLVSRLPEVGLILDRSSNSSLGKVLEAELTYGHIREYTTKTTGNRLNLQVSGRPWTIGGLGEWDLDFSPGARLSHYSSGDTYRDAYGELSLVRRLDARNRTEITFSQHMVGGKTPFAFDEVFLPTELRGKWLKSLGRFSLDLAARYDVRRNSIFDYKIGLGFVTHCIEPKLVWRGRTQTFGMELGLVGFTLDD